MTQITQMGISVASIWFIWEICGCLPKLDTFLPLTPRLLRSLGVLRVRSAIWTDAQLGAPGYPERRAGTVW